MSWQECGWSRRKSGVGSGRVAIFCYAWGCGFSGLVLKDSTGEPKSWGAALRKREKAAAWQSPAEPCGAQAAAAMIAASGAAAGTAKFSSPAPTQSGPEGGSSDLLQRSVRFCLVPVLPLFSV